MSYIILYSMMVRFRNFLVVSLTIIVPLVALAQ